MEVVMRQHRLVLTDRLSRPIAPLLPGKATDRGVTARDNRLFLQAVLTEGAHWRDYPPASGTGTVRWAASLGTSSVVQRVFEALRGDPDLAYLLRDDCLASPESRWGKRGGKGQ
ncbi:MAG: transposase [Synechococcus sp. SB0667_bin_8]|nr:transposase [Synechococcus sp. SB0667_bin_8]